MSRTKVAGPLALALTLSIGLASATTATPATAAQPTPAPLAQGEKQAVPDQYIVVLKDTVAASAAGGVSRTALAHGGTLRAGYSHALNGFAAHLPGEALKAVRADPAVAYVVPDTVVEPATDQTNPPSWGLDRIDQRRGLPNFDNLYRYDSTGSGATVFVVDSGIRATHADFGGRATGVYDAVGDGNGTNDCNGHGTHVAGTVAGASYGVAKGAQIRAVRIFDCTGNGVSSDLIEAIDFITANHPARSIANFSLHSSNTAVNDALEGLIDSGVQAVVAAGNHDNDACADTTITTVTRAIVVAASVQGDGRAFFSNYGTCVEIFAPGLDIVSAAHTSDTAGTSMSGTSMAAPHVAGWIARHLEENPTATIAQTREALIAVSSKGILGDAQLGAGSLNRLLWADPANTPPDSTPPATPGAPLVTDVTDTSVTMTFPLTTDNEAVAGYYLYQTVGAAETLIARLPANGNLFTATGLSPGTTYSYKVQAHDTSANLSGVSSSVTITTAGAHSCQVHYQISGGGNTFTADLTVTNNGPATLAGWFLEFPFADGQQLLPGAGQNWGAAWTQDGNWVVARNLSWNETITPNSSVHIGFNASHTGTNTVPGFFFLNGVLCTTV